jgi:23S rRNA (cytosine1962-C5)-methyltransferase
MANERHSNSRLRLRVNASAESILRSGHPWLFAESVRDQNREGQLGDLAVIYDHNDRFLAVGLFDPDSPIRVRVLHAGKPEPIDHAWWSQRLAEALDRRRGLFDEQTTGYRCINGESDGWPGLVLDRYDQTLVLKLYTAAWLPRLQEIAGLIEEHLRPERMVLRLSRNIQSAAENRFSRTDGEIMLQRAGHASPAAPASPPVLGEGNKLAGKDAGSPGARPTTSPWKGMVVFRETGLQFEADVLRGQKTGFFLDQRENRRQVESLADGRSVLNAFSFTGGFSLYAARGGARGVTDLDISAHALAGASRNFALNESQAQVAACRQEQVQAEAFEWLGGNATRRFDLVILDPPSLAKRESDRTGAIHAYGRLASLGIGHLARGGILLACSCSAHVTAQEFFAAVRASAAKSGRRFAELLTTSHAADHPATFQEAEYLKAIYLRL